MTDALIGAIGTVVGAAVGATIPLCAKALSERRRYYLSKDLNFIEGAWEGNGGDLFVDGTAPPIAFTLTLNLRRRGRKIFGSGEISLPEGAVVSKDISTTDKLSFEGGFFDAINLQLIYRGTNSGSQQRGVALFRLKGYGKQMVGFYAGFSPARECFVVGEVHVSKGITRNDEG